MNLQVIKNRIRKAFTYTFAGIAFLVVSIFLALQIPTVQQYFIQRYLKGFSEVIGFQTSVDGFQLLWFDRLELINLKVLDPDKNEMITAERALINFKLLHLFNQQDVNVDGVYLENANVFLTKIQETDTSRNLNINVFINRINEQYGGSGGGGRPPRINIGEAFLDKSHFKYVDQDQDSIKEGFNYNHFALNVDEGQIQNFMIQGDTTQFHVNTLLATDQQTQFRVRQLSTFFRLSQQSMEFLGLNLQAGESVITDTIVMTFQRQLDLAEFVSKVRIQANFDSTIIHPKDLALFAPEAKRLTDPILIKGKFNGRIDNFRLTNMQVGTGQSLMKGSLDMEGLPDINETFIILNLKDSRIDFNDFRFLFNDQVLSRLLPMGRLVMQGEFLGYPTDFVARGEFDGKLGKINSDINFKVNEKDFDRSVYSGKLALYDFKLGEYLRDTLNFQNVTVNGNVKGSGLSVKNADFVLNGRVYSIGIRQYNYSNITTNARFARQLFNGVLNIDDPNLQFNAKGSVDFRKGKNTIKMEAQIDTVFLRNLKLTSDSIFLHTQVNLDIKGLQLDSISGTADLKDFRLMYANRWLSLKDIHIASELNPGSRRIIINTDLVDAQANGNFLLSDISSDVQTLIREILLNIKNDKQALANYYREKVKKPNSYQTNFIINLKAIEPLVNLLSTDVWLSHNTKIEGKFTSGYTSILQAYTYFDSLTYNGKVFLGNEIDFTASKIADSTSVLASVSLRSEQQRLSKAFNGKDLLAEAIWNNNHVDFTFDADQDGQSNYIRLKGGVDFDRDSTHINIEPSTLKVLEKIWQFDPDNSISIRDRNVSIRKLTLSNEDHFATLRGIVSENPEEKLTAEIRNFDLSLLNSIIGRKLAGNLNAIFDFSNLYGSPSIENDLRIDSLTFNDFLVGDITGSNIWDTTQRHFTLNFFIDRQQSRIVNLQGFYTPSLKQSPLDVNAHLERANLKIIEPFIEDIFSNVGGTITGDFRITGPLAAPEINGEGKMNDGQIMVNYLRTTYKFNGTFAMTPTTLGFRNVELFDAYNNKAKLDGVISHRNFYSMNLDFDARFSDFQLLNTTARDNTLFYGQGYASGDMKLFGPVENLKLTANARTERNTRIYIPIGGASDVERKEFIKFVNFTDSTFQKSLEENVSNKVSLTGLSMDFNLDVTPEAYCEIIIDIKTGDIIRGRGNGDLQLQLDTNGEFNMFGPFEFTEGAYNFTLYDIVNKDFIINKGSKINWYGDAYTGVLDISAAYRQLASFGAILTDQTLSNLPQFRRKYPVDVQLSLEGPMLSPEIKFDIVANDLPKSVPVEGRGAVSLAFEFQTFRNRIDEQELYRQVFSLIVLRRFSPQESFNTSGSLANSVSELLSNQLSNWISQVDENLEFDVDLSGFDQEAYNTFQLRLSYTLLNGRLRITRDGTIYGNQNQNGLSGPSNFQQNSAATIAGDWTVDYLLTPDGKLKIKMYNRTNFNPVLNTLGAQNPVTAGMSLSHTQTFNAVRDLWRSARRRREDESQVIEQNEEAIKNEEDAGQ